MNAAIVATRLERIIVDLDRAAAWASDSDPQAGADVADVARELRDLRLELEREQWKAVAA